MKEGFSAAFAVSAEQDIAAAEGSPAEGGSPAWGTQAAVVGTPAVVLEGSPTMTLR